MAIILKDESNNEHIELTTGDVGRKIVFTGVPSNAQFKISTGPCGAIEDANVTSSHNSYTVIIPNDYLITSKVISVFISTSNGEPVSVFYFPVRHRCV